MLESRYVRSKCDKCHRQNEIALIHFLNSDYRFAESIVALCQECNKDFTVKLEGSLIQ